MAVAVPVAVPVAAAAAAVDQEVHPVVTTGVTTPTSATLAGAIGAKKMAEITVTNDVMIVDQMVLHPLAMIAGVTTVGKSSRKTIAWETVEEVFTIFQNVLNLT